METIETYQDLFDNIGRLEGYLASSDPVEREFGQDLVRRGLCFVVYKDKGQCRFAPSRFVGYKNNTKDLHLANASKDGRVTNPVISRILDQQCTYRHIADTVVLLVILPITNAGNTG